MKFCTEANHTILFKILQNNNFYSCPIQGANIQPVPKNWNTSFHWPLKNPIDSIADVALIQLVYKKVRVISKYFNLGQRGKNLQFLKVEIDPWCNGDTVTIVCRGRVILHQNADFHYQHYQHCQVFFKILFNTVVKMFIKIVVMIVVRAAVKIVKIVNIV